MISVKINGKTVQTEGGTILEVLKENNIYVPTLCYAKKIGAIASCRVCLVEVKGVRNLVTACNTPVIDSMEIITNSARVYNARRTNVELLLSDHEMNCTECQRTTNCALKKVANETKASAEKFAKNLDKRKDKDDSTNYLRLNRQKCILCGRCARVCSINQYVGIWSVNQRGFDAHIGCAFDRPLNKVPCIACGQCVLNCPTAALTEVDNLHTLKKVMSDKTKHVFVATAPSTRVALGEEFGLEIGTNVQGKMVAALKMLGFEKVFDLDLGADFTIMEEANEFLDRLNNGGKLPMFTSCCPGWINFCEMFHPELLNNLSTAKSPMQMFGALVKSYYCQKQGIDPKDVYLVMLMPCIAKQSEAERKEFKNDVDLSITVRQAAILIREAGINFANLKDEEYDNPLSMSSGAGLIFGTTGGVTEAALRTISETILGKTVSELDFHNVRGQQGIKMAELTLKGKKVKAAVVSGIANAQRVIEDIKSGKEYYDFIEVMACPGGCANGSGMPIPSNDVQATQVDMRKRAETLYSMDQYCNLRRSHTNPTVVQIYKEFLGKPNGEMAHKLLHTKYKARKRFN